jgi:hypothetical protein
MTAVQRVGRIHCVFGSDQQVGPADSRIHSTGIIGSNHRLNPDLVQNAFRDLSVRR